MGNEDAVYFFSTHIVTLYRSRTSHTLVRCGQSPPYLQNVLISCNRHRASREEGKTLLASLSAATAIDGTLMHMCALTLHVFSHACILLCACAHAHTHIL